MTPAGSSYKNFTVSHSNKSLPSLGIKTNQDFMTPYFAVCVLVGWGPVFLLLSLLLIGNDLSTYTSCDKIHSTYVSGGAYIYDNRDNTPTPSPHLSWVRRTEVSDVRIDDGVIIDDCVSITSGQRFKTVGHTHFYPYQIRGLGWGLGWSLNGHSRGRTNYPSSTPPVEPPPLKDVEYVVVTKRFLSTGFGVD